VTKKGRRHCESKNYKLVVPPNVPVRNFWAITTYDLETASYIRNVEKSSIDSTQKQLQKNADGSVDIYFGPKAPKGKESNWLPTDPKRRFFLLSRFYGPETGGDSRNSMNRFSVVPGSCLNAADCVCQA